MQVLESEVKAYKDIIKNMGKEADRLQKLDPASAKEISSTQVDNLTLPYLVVMFILAKWCHEYAYLYLQLKDSISNNLY